MKKFFDCSGMNTANKIIFFSWTISFILSCITQIVFLVLKVANVIFWNWYIVLIPAFILLALIIILFISFIIYLGSNS